MFKYYKRLITEDSKFNRFFWAVIIPILLIEAVYMVASEPGKANITVLITMIITTIAMYIADIRGLERKDLREEIDKLKALLADKTETQNGL